VTQVATQSCSCRRVLAARSDWARLSREKPRWRRVQIVRRDASSHRSEAGRFGRRDTSIRQVGPRFAPRDSPSRGYPRHQPRGKSGGTVPPGATGSTNRPISTWARSLALTDRPESSILGSGRVWATSSRVELARPR
jgi:hypothetical protein